MTLIPLPAAAVTLNLPTIVVRQLVRQDALTGYRIGGVLKVDDTDLAGVRDVEIEQARAIVEGRAERDRLRRALDKTRDNQRADFQSIAALVAQDLERRSL